MPLIKYIWKTHTLGTSTSGKGMTRTIFTLPPETTKITGQTIRKNYLQDTGHQATKNRYLWEKGKKVNPTITPVYSFESFQATEGGTWVKTDSLRKASILERKFHISDFRFYYTKKRRASQIQRRH